MKKYLRKFATQEEYQQWRGTEMASYLPNVCLIAGETNVIFLTMSEIIK